MLKKNFNVNTVMVALFRNKCHQSKDNKVINIKEAFEYSFSCYNPNNGQPCWKCKPCFRKFVSFALNNYPFPQEVIDTCLDYIRTDILPQIKDGTYGRKQEEQEILKVLELYDNK